MTLELDDDFAIVDEGRHDRFGIELHVGRIELVAAQNVDVDAFPRQGFFRQHDADLGGANRRSMMIKRDHCSLPPVSDEAHSGP